MVYEHKYFIVRPCITTPIKYTNTMRSQYTIKEPKEVKEAKAKAILDLKFGLVQLNSVAYWIALGNKQETV